MNKPERGCIDTYQQFRLFYLREHHRPGTRRWHIAGTLFATTCIVAAIVLANPWLLLAAAIAGYGPAWVAHFLIEQNQPATWRYPLWSLVSDFRMTFACLSGNLTRELHKAGVDYRKH